MSLTDIFVGVVFCAYIRHTAGHGRDAALIRGALSGVGHGHIAKLLQVFDPTLHGAVSRIVQLAKVAVPGVAVSALVRQGGDLRIKNLLSSF